MNKEQLQQLGLTDDQIAEVFKINGQDIEALKAANSTAETEKSNLQALLTAANKQIEDFTKLDIDAIKTEAATYKQKYEAEQTANAEKVQALQLQHTIDNALLIAKTKNAKAAKALLNVEELKTSKDLTKDLESQIAAVKESDPYLFEQEDNGKPPVVGGSKQTPPPRDKKMTYSEMLEYLEKNPGAKL